MKITKGQLRRIIESISDKMLDTQIPDYQLLNPDFIETGFFKKALAYALQSKGYNLTLERTSTSPLVQWFSIPGAHVALALQLYYNGNVVIEIYERYDYLKGFKLTKNINWPGDNQKALNILVAEASSLIQQALDAVEERATKSSIDTPVASNETWSVAVLGKEHSYVTEIEYYTTKEEAIEAAKDMGGAYVLKGTQMWNEPLGQVEESDRNSKARWVSEKP